MPTDRPDFLRTSAPLENLSEPQRQELRERIEKGFLLQNGDPGWFSLLAERSQWDAAIVLDACRFDVFEKVNFIPGRLARRISPGSCTEDWIAATFDGKFDDVVYLSASPYISRWYLDQIRLPMPFAHIEDIWRSGWDDSLHTVPPVTVAAAYRRLRPAFPQKKFILHFMQPHHPYIGAARVTGAGWRKYFGAMELDSPQLEGQTPVEMLESGQADRAAVLAAYEANLTLALRKIETLLPELPPRSVITADHGEAFGECGIYGHPCGLPMPELIAVPYLVVDKS